MSTRFQLRTLSLALSLGFAALPAAHAEAWKFGLMGDTQWTVSGTGVDGLNVNTVAVRQVLAVNQQFIAHGVKFAIQVGDLGDNGSNASLQTRLDANYALVAAGIPFYGVRGNHEASAAAKTFFKNNYIPAPSAGTAVSVAAFDSANYLVDTLGVKLFFMDYDVTGSTTLLPGASSWIRDTLVGGSQQHAFVITHKNLLGQNHKDNFFGSSNDANPTLQNNFLKALKDGDVRYFLSGHDHMHHRSLVASPDSQSAIRQSIAQSNSSKWYTPSTPYSTRETPLSQQLNKIGYYIYTVDGPRVTGQYYSSTPVNNDVAANPAWTLDETFGYSKNGVSRLVAQGGSHVMTHSIARGSNLGEAGFVGTTMRILAGTNTATTTVYGGRPTTKDINIGWAAQNGALASDVLTLWGMQNALGSEQGDTYVLALDYPATLRGALALMTKTDSGWAKAVSRNFGGSGKFVVGPWRAEYTLGTYGVDPATQTAWAVVNRGGEFAVARSNEGDLNGDGVVDSRDVALVSQRLNQPASALPGADLDGDGVITALDARKLALICNLANCAIAAAN
jgi:hypothetical protein